MYWPDSGQVVKPGQARWSTLISVRWSTLSQVISPSRPLTLATSSLTTPPPPFGRKSQNPHLGRSHHLIQPTQQLLCLQVSPCCQCFLINSIHHVSHCQPPCRHLCQPCHHHCGSTLINHRDCQETNAWRRWRNMKVP